MLTPLDPVDEVHVFYDSEKLKIKNITAILSETIKQ
jgi:hypothetical protein|tara:strand:- start:250 stop:357 length:108 start_codon:yes stop_codon:yes gene_type:complete